MLSVEFIEECISLAKSHEASQRSIDKDQTISPLITTATPSSLDLGGDAVLSPPNETPDAHAVSQAEALSYYAGLHSEPTLLYRTGKKWSPPTGPEAQRRLKELIEVFNHPITKVWNNDLGWAVVKVMDAHKVPFTTIDVVRFKNVEVDEAADEEAGEPKKPVVNPVTIWIGVFPGSITATAAHDAAQVLLVLLKDYHITDVDVDFRESIYTRQAGPQLLEPVGDLDPLVDVVSALTPALGLRISTSACPNAEGTMALYLAEGGGSDKLLGLSCRHVLIEPEGNFDYIHHPGAPPQDVVLLGTRSFTNLVKSIKLRIGRHGILTRRWKRQVERFEEREKGTNTADVAKAKDDRLETEISLEKATKAMEELGVLHDQVNKNWKTLDSRVLGHIVRSPALRLGVGEQQFTEDWAIFRIDRTKLGNGFQGNKIDLGTKLAPDEFTVKCFPRGDADWEFEYPEDRLLPLVGTITDDLLRAPDMWDLDGEPCLLVVKSGNATGTTIGRANGVFSIVRDYFLDMSIHQTSMEWAIINYDSKSEAFSSPGDSGSIIADIRGRIGGMLTGGAGKSRSCDLTYATPFWWLLERIKANGFADAHLDCVA